MPRTQVMAVVTERHERFYKTLLPVIGIQQVVSQPQNRGTAPGILYLLLRLAALAPEASVVIFPSDHHVSDDRRFAAHVDSAFLAAEADPGRIVLPGAIPDTHEVSLYDAFAALGSPTGAAEESSAVAALYQWLASSDFSRDVLSARPEALGVIPVRGVTWSDRGSPERVLRVRKQLEPRVLSSPRPDRPPSLESD